MPIVNNREKESKLQEIIESVKADIAQGHMSPETNGLVPGIVAGKYSARKTAIFTVYLPMDTVIGSEFVPNRPYATLHVKWINR